VALACTEPAHEATHWTGRAMAMLAWLTRHPRWTFHFTPTSASWLNAVENFFSKMNAAAHPPWHLPLGFRPAGGNPYLSCRAQCQPQTLRLD
jgi:hypothetical protein